MGILRALRLITGVWEISRIGLEIALTADMSKLSHRLIIFLLFVALGANCHLVLAQTKPVPKAVKPNVTEAEIAEAREWLGRLGYWIDLNAKGLDASLYHSLIAFQKITERKRTGVLTTDELMALRNATQPMPREMGFPHIEVDLSRQVLFAVECCGASVRVLPISSGSGAWFTEGGKTRQAITPIGRFAITRQIKGWRKSPLGLLYYPNYIHNGIAIHGNPAVPAQPASHGCIRIPMFAAKDLSDMVQIGMSVIVYDDSPVTNVGR